MFSLSIITVRDYMRQKVDMDMQIQYFERIFIHSLLILRSK